MDRYITRQQAFDVLESLIESDILSDEVCDALHSIAECIEEERYCRHIWGGDPEEICELYTAHREDLITPEIINRCAEIHQKQIFTMMTMTMMTSVILLIKEARYELSSFTGGRQVGKVL